MLAHYQPLMKLRHEVVSLMRQDPRLFFPLIRLNKRLGFNKGLSILSQETELVIEGFLRCGNSFVTRAFVSAQPRKVIVANRTHAPATVIQAVKWGLPTLVLIREPTATIASLALKHPHLTLRQGLRDYIRYYTTVFPYRAGYITATFKAATSDLGALIDQLNQRFGTSFARFEHTEQNMRQVFEQIERVDHVVERGDRSKYSTPSAEKEELKAAIGSRLEAEELRPLVEAANAIYSEFVDQPAPRMAGSR
jgi:hypothetical protein